MCGFGELVGRCLLRQCYHEGAALTWRALDPDSAAVRLDDRFADIQPEPYSLYLGAVIQPCERLKEVLDLIGAEPDAVIGNANAGFACFTLYRYLHLAAGRRILDRL